MQNTSNTSKTIGIVIIVLIILAGVWLMTRTSGETTVETESSTATTTPVEQANPAVSGIQSSGSSDTALDSDAAAIEAEIQSYGSDNSSAQAAVAE